MRTTPISPLAPYTRNEYFRRCVVAKGIVTRQFRWQRRSMASTSSLYTASARYLPDALAHFGHERVDVNVAVLTWFPRLRFLSSAVIPL